MTDRVDRGDGGPTPAGAGRNEADGGATPAGSGLIVLSPHLDDAVLSVGGLIARTTAAGDPVEVWTACTAGPDEGTLPRRLRRFARYQVRLAEDDRALELLGAGRHRLGLAERIWTEPARRSLAAAFRTPAARDGFHNLEPLAAAVRAALDRPGTRLLAPLGVGGHADHVELALAALSVVLEREALPRAGFYEDYYALGRAARRRHVITGTRPQPRDRSAGWAAPPAGLVLWLTSRITAGPGLERYLPGITGLDWHCRPEPLADRDERRKLAAVAAYRSQTPALGGRWQLTRILRRAHRLHGGELIWRAAPR